MLRRRTILAGMAALALPVLGLTACAPAVKDTGNTVYIVRHAEKVLGVDDPALTPDGAARAEALAERLAKAGITHIHSTDTRRTRDTAAPTAAATGLEVALYDAADAAGFTDMLKRTPGRHLVIAHSNTAPGLALRLGADPGDDIVEATEYDRLYVIEQVGEDDRPPGSSRIERYGEPSPR